MILIYRITIRYILGTIFLFVGSIILHEVCHFLIAKATGLKVKRIVIGNEKYSLKIGPIYLSPLLTSAYIVIDETSLLNLSNIRIIVFYMAGILGNIIFFIIIKVLTYSNMLLSLNKYVLLVSLVANILPIIKNNDANRMIDILKRRINHNEKE